jgi:hypothetical protein
MANDINVIKTIFEAAQIGKAQFVYIKNYRNQQGEVSNYLINLGMSYDEQRLKDIAKLEAKKFEQDTIKEIARREMLDSKIKNTSDETRTNASKAQIDAYLELCNNVKLHKESFELHMKSFLVKKEIIIPGVYKPVNSSDKTIAKRQIGKELDLSTDNYRQFKFANMDQTVISINGEKIEITYTGSHDEPAKPAKKTPQKVNEFDIVPETERLDAGKPW